MVQKEMILIEDLLTDEWWQDVSLPMLENIRKRLRPLGVEGVFGPQAAELVEILAEIERRSAT